MEFLDEYESKPRFLFQSKHLPRADKPFHPPSYYLSSLLKPTLFISLSFSLLIFCLAFVYFDSEPLKSLLLWFTLSFLVGPFAPTSLTAGDIRVGVGPPLKEIPASPIEINEKPSRKSTKALKKASEDTDAHLEKSNAVDASHVDSTKKQASISDVPSLIVVKPEEWVEADDDLLKKLMGKHPVGKPGRWEAIAEGFKGKHKVETVMAKAKQVGEKKASDRDAFDKFLKDRKPVDKRCLDEEEGGLNVEEGRKEGGWTPAEDLALLNALKAFPKEAAMRWEKVASSVPGKTKAACVKRVADLKKDFRSSKTSASAQS